MSQLVFMECLVFVTFIRNRLYEVTLNKYLVYDDMILYDLQLCVGFWIMVNFITYIIHIFCSNEGIRWLTRSQNTIDIYHLITVTYYAILCNIGNDFHPFLICSKSNHLYRYRNLALEPFEWKKELILSSIVQGNTINLTYLRYPL